MGLSSEENIGLHRILSGCGRPAEWACLEYTLHYADTQLPVDMLQRNRYRDTFDLFKPCGPMHEKHPHHHASFGAHTTQGIPACQRGTDNSSAPWTSDMLMATVAQGLLEVSMRFATNITSH